MVIKPGTPLPVLFINYHIIWLLPRLFYTFLIINFCSFLYIMYKRLCCTITPVRKIIPYHITVIYMRFHITTSIFCKLSCFIFYGVKFIYIYPINIPQPILTCTLNILLCLHQNHLLYKNYIPGISCPMTFKFCYPLI